MRYDCALSSIEGCALCVEERFSVQWSHEDNTVWCAVTYTTYGQ